MVFLRKGNDGICSGFRQSLEILLTIFTFTKGSAEYTYSLLGFAAFEQNAQPKFLTAVLQTESLET